MTLPLVAPTSHLEALFHASSVDLIVPDVSNLPSNPVAEGVSHQELAEWWARCEACQTRGMAFFDERLLFLVSVMIPDQLIHGLDLSPASKDVIPTELQKFVSRLQFTMTASFIPPLPVMQSRQSRQSLPSNNPTTPTPMTSSTLAPPTTSGSGSEHHHQYSGGGGGQSYNGDIPLATPNPFPAMAAAEAQYANVEGITVWEGAVEEISVSGKIDGEDGMPIKGASISTFRVKDGWQIVKKGELPIAYVRTPIQNPLLSLTASVTLRDGSESGRSHKRRAFSVASERSGTETIHTEGTAPEDSDEDDENDTAGMVDIDLLGGLAGAANVLPGSRLGPSLRTDLSLPLISPTSAFTAASVAQDLSFSVPPTSTSTSASGPSRERGHLPTLSTQTTTTTLRKSFRRVLSLSSGLRVRMRTLFLPQLIAPRKFDPDNATEQVVDQEGEKRVVLCVEIENTVPGRLENGFEVERVIVEVGGKGGKATPELICQPEQRLGKDVFPLRLCSVDQYNLLYAVSIASSSDLMGSSSVGLEEAVAKTMGRGDEQRPVSIIIAGRPFLLDDQSNGQLSRPTSTFNSRWNCNLDLTAFYASLASSPSNPVAPQPGPSSISTKGSRPSRPQTLVSPPNAIAGDKRYSLASLLSSSSNDANSSPNAGGPSRLLPQRRLVSGTQSQKPLMPSQIMNNNNRDRVPSYRTNPPAALTVSQPNSISTNNNMMVDADGLLLSFRLLPQLARNDSAYDASFNNIANMDVGMRSVSQAMSIKAFDVFSIEVFVYNRTREARRFKLGIPGREDDDRLGLRIRDFWSQRRKRTPEEANWGSDDGVLRQLLLQHETTCPAIVPLETDVRCGPLIPGASLSARIRFMAIREGVHAIEKIRISGVGGDQEFDHVITPVLDIVVGQG